MLAALLGPSQERNAHFLGEFASSTTNSRTPRTDPHETSGPTLQPPQPQEGERITRGLLGFPPWKTGHYLPPGWSTGCYCTATSLP